MINNANIVGGEVIVGLASFGQATYEKEYNGGMGSNGLTSARHDVFAKYIAEKYPETYDNTLSPSVTYIGTKSLTEKVHINYSGKQISVEAGKLVLSPTRTYAPIIKEILDKFSGEIHGLVHCSGGGQTKVLHFIENVHIIKDNLFAIPPLFQLIQKESGTDWKEMYTVFNMGHRMEIYTDVKTAIEIIAIAGKFKIEAQVIGRVESSEQNKLTIRSDHGVFEW